MLIPPSCPSNDFPLHTSLSAVPNEHDRPDRAAKWRRADCLAGFLRLEKNARLVMVELIGGLLRFRQDGQQVLVRCGQHRVGHEKTSTLDVAFRHRYG
jgi:hypothetical protein